MHPCIPPPQPRRNAKTRTRRGFPIIGKNRGRTFPKIGTSGRDGYDPHRRPEMKSSYELAMERLEQKHGKRSPMTDAQKKMIGEIDERVRAKIAELEIMLKPRIAEAQRAGDYDLARKVEENLRNEIAKVRDEGEADKESARNGG
jgi:hypothetical protein